MIDLYDVLLWYTIVFSTSAVHSIFFVGTHFSIRRTSINVITSNLQVWRKPTLCQRKTFLSQRLIIPTLFSNICINYIPLMTQTIHLYDADRWCFLRFVSKHTPSQLLPSGRRLHTDMNYSSLDWLCIYWNIFLTASKTKTR